MADGRGQRTEDRRQLAEVRWQRTEDRGQMTEVRYQKTEDRDQSCRKWECGLRPVGAIGAYAPEGMRNDRIASLCLFI